MGSGVERRPRRGRARHERVAAGYPVRLDGRRRRPSASSACASCPCAAAADRSSRSSRAGSRGSGRCWADHRPRRHRPTRCRADSVRTGADRRCGCRRWVGEVEHQACARRVRANPRAFAALELDHLVVSLRVGEVDVEAAILLVPGMEGRGQHSLLTGVQHPRADVQERLRLRHAVAQHYHPAALLDDEEKLPVLLPRRVDDMGGLGEAPDLGSRKPPSPSPTGGVPRPGHQPDRGARRARASRAGGAGRNVASLIAQRTPAGAGVRFASFGTSR